MNYIKKTILWIIASWVAIYLTFHYFPEYLNIEWWIKSFLISWMIFWIFNSIIKPILKLVSLPFILITAWLFVLLINASIIYLTEYFFLNVESLNVVFEIKWWILAYILVSTIISLFNYCTQWLIKID